VTSQVGELRVRVTEEEFDGFYQAVFARLVGQLALVTGDLHEAEDVVQEALTRAAGRWARLRAYDVPEAWVRRVALNLATSHHRQARRRLAALLRLGPPPVVPPVSADALALAEALRALSMPHRQVLVLHHLLGLPVEEVARELAVPVGTVKARLARGRRALARRLAEPVREGPNHG
jgi:RNA polymerase sigma-70 factor (ECF subfamily)